MSFSLISFVASRLTKTNRKKGFLNLARNVAFVSVMLGTVALLVSLSVLSGYEKLLQENAVKFTSHITVSSFNHKPLPEADKSIDYLYSNIKEIKNLAPVIQRESLIRSKSFVEGIMIKGIESDYGVSEIRKNIIEGDYVKESDKSNSIIIGKRLAGKLNVKLGDSVVIYAVSEANSSQMTYPDIARFKIIGLYETGMAKYDDVVAFIPFRTAVYMFKMPAKSCTNIEVTLHDISKVNEVSEKIEDQLGYPHFCMTVFELHSSIFAWIEIQKQPIPIVLGLITLVAVFNIFTILLITVIEKTYSIGILTALGLNRKSIITIFIRRGTLLGTAGTLSGAALALIFSVLQINFKLIRLKGEIYFLDALPIDLNIWNYLLVIFTTIAMSVIATLIPAYFASKANPIKSIHYR